MTKASPSSRNKTQKKTANSPTNRESMRIEVLDQAAKTLNTHGVSQVSLAAIAKSLGTSRAALYYYVDNQEDLVYQCYTRTCQQLAGYLDVATTEHTHALDILDEFIASSLDTKRAEFASLSDVAFLKEENHSIVLGLYKGIRASLADVIALGIDKGELRPCNPRIVASIVIGLITWAPAILMWKATEQAPKETLIKTLQSIICAGMATNRKNHVVFKGYNSESFVSIPGNVFDPDFLAAARKETLLTSASWLFSQKGVDATSLDEIAERVGVTKKVIYHNMGSKEDLVSSSYRRGFRFLNFVADNTKAFEGTRLDAFANTLFTLAEASIRQDITPFIPTNSLDTWHEDAQKEARDLAAKLIKSYSKMYRQGIKEGSIRNLDTLSIMTLFPGSYEWMPRWIGTFTEHEKQLMPNEVANFLSFGLGSV